MALKELGSVSTYECRQFLDIYCPPARKFDLVQQGYPIETQWQTIQAESGEQRRVGVYVLKSERRTPARQTGARKLAHANKTDNGMGIRSVAVHPKCI